MIRIVPLLITMLMIGVAPILVSSSAAAETDNQQDPSIFRTISREVRIDPGDSYYVYFDSGNLQFASMQQPRPSDEERNAIERVPEWMRADLSYKFDQLPDSECQTYAGLLNSASSEYVDEIGFCIAHSSVETLTNDNVRPVIYEQNAFLIYHTAPLLKYVRIYEEDGSTTLEYNTSDAGWVRLPPEIYYWDVVHPQLSDELPLYVDPDYNYTTQPPFSRDHGVDPDQGEFWREWFFDHADPGYPLLSECVRNSSTLMDAVHGLNTWVGGSMKFTSDTERPNQPVRIYQKHIGRCGEHQDMRCSAARTVLVPTVCASNAAEDHVWNEFWERRWIHWDGVMDNPLMYENGWGKKISSVWTDRGDGYTLQVTPRYTRTCKLDTTVLDNNGLPVDGAMVKVQTENYYNHDILTTTTWMTTDHDGRASVRLGDERNYWLSVNSESLGDEPAHGSVKVIEDSVADATYDHNFTMSRSAPRLKATAATYPANAQDRFRMDVDVDVRSHITSGRNAYSGDHCDIYGTSGKIDMFICDEFNHMRYKNDLPFDAYGVHERVSEGSASLVLPGEDTWYAVLSNGFSQTTATTVNITVRIVSPLRLTLTSPTGGEILDLGSIVTLTGTTQSPRPVSSVRVEVDGSGVWSTATKGADDWSSWSYNWNTPGLDPGPHSLRVMVRDSGQNLSVTVNVTLRDVTDPTVRITAPPDGTEIRQGSFPVLQGSATDDVAVARLEYLLDWDEADPVEMTLSGSSFSAIVETAAMEPGAHTITVRAMDTAGNSNGTTVGITILESNAPLVEISAPAREEVIKLGDTVEVRGQATDDMEVSSLVIYTGSDQGVELIDDLVSDEWSYEWDTGALSVDEGSCTIRVTATDSSHNTANRSITVELDGTPPDLVVSAPTDDVFFSADDIVISGDVSDASGIASLLLSADGGVPVDISGSIVGTGFNYMNTGNLGTGPGSHTLLLSARDTAGWTSVQTLAVVIDNTPPSVELRGEEVASLGGMYHLDGTLLDDSRIEMVEFTMDSSKHVDITTSLGGSSLSYNIDTTGLSDGTHYIRVVATDAAGNTGTGEFVVVFLGPGTDTDLDGMPDLWEMEHGLDRSTADQDVDSDGDGFSNLEEYRARTDPMDATEHPLVPAGDDATPSDTNSVPLIFVGVFIVASVLLLVIFSVVVLFMRIRPKFDSC